MTKKKEYTKLPHAKNWIDLTNNQKLDFFCEECGAPVKGFVYRKQGGMCRNCILKAVKNGD